MPLRDLTELPNELGQLVNELITHPPLNRYLQISESQTHLTTRLAHQFSLADLLLAA